MGTKPRPLSCKAKHSTCSGLGQSPLPTPSVTINQASWRMQTLWYWRPPTLTMAQGPYGTGIEPGSIEPGSIEHPRAHPQSKPLALYLTFVCVPFTSFKANTSSKTLRTIWPTSFRACQRLHVTQSSMFSISPLTSLWGRANKKKIECESQAGRSVSGLRMLSFFSWKERACRGE